MPDTDWPAAPAQAAVTIRHANADFYNHTVRALEKIRQTTGGAALLNALTAARTGPGRRVVIRSGAASLCRGGGNSTRTLLAQAVLDNTGIVTTEIDNALTSINKAGNYAWLATAMKMCPLYDIQQAPNGVASNINITLADIQGWYSGVLAAAFPFTAAGVNADQVRQLLLTALADGAMLNPGIGTNSLVEWSQSTHITLTSGIRAARPKAVGLSHELIHALYNATGQQMGVDNGHYSTVLFEYQCVGLGPWTTYPISENKVRSEWQTVVNDTMFGGRLPIHANAVVARPQY